MTTPVKKTVHEALMAVMREVREVDKSDKSDEGGFKFRGIDTIVNAVSPSLRKHKVIVIPVLEGEPTYSTATNAAGRTLSVCRLVLKVVFVGPDGSRLIAIVPGESWDSGDKATAKAMSVALRTALIQTLMLATGEPDPDHFKYDQVDDTSGPVDQATMDRIGLLMQSAELDTLDKQNKYIFNAIGHIPTAYTADDAGRLERALKHHPKNRT